MHYLPPPPPRPMMPFAFAACATEMFAAWVLTRVADRIAGRAPELAEDLDEPCVTCGEES